MSTSGSYSYTVNRDQIIRQAMLTIGKLDESEVPNAQEISDCAFVLNLMIKQWQGRTDFSPGLKVWTRRRGYLFLNSTTGQYSVGPTATGWTNSFVGPLTTAVAASAATSIVVSSATGIAATYNIGIQLDSGALYWTTVSSVSGTTVNLSAALPSQSSSGSQVYCYSTTAQLPLTIETALLRDNQNSDTPLRILTVQDYDMLPNKADPKNIGDPTAIYYEFQLDNANLFTDVGAANDVTKYIVMTFLETIQDVLSASDNFEYPQEWFLPLALGLSKQIAPMFNATWTALMQNNYDEALAIARRKDPERVTMYFQPGAEE